MTGTFLPPPPSPPADSPPTDGTPGTPGPVVPRPADIPASILLVDDDPRNLDVLESVLTCPEYRLVRAQTSDEALLALLHGDFAAIVLDVHMPDLSGFDLARLIKERKRTQHIPIIFLTAFHQEEHEVLQGYHVGAVDYLTKPINPGILRSKVGVFTDLFRTNRALAMANHALELEVHQRERAEAALREANRELESRVEERTADLRIAKHQAESALKAKDEFLATLSHELRTPLSPVLLIATEALRNLSLPEAVRADFATVLKCIELEARLIDDLLDLTRITRGKLSIDLRTVDAHAVLQEAIQTVRPDLEARRQSLELQLAAGSCWVRADEVRLKQVFWNILKNAVKFTPDGGRIAVESVNVGPPEAICVCIRDNGIGMTTGELARVFDAFAQGDHAVTSGAHQYGGIGLGLTISRMLVDLLGGKIRASSEGRHRGSTFVIEFPAQTAPSPDATGALPSAETTLVLPSRSPDQPPCRILLVEDHEPTRAALRLLLTRRRFQVTTASSSAEARRLADEGSFDFVISDIGLPDGSGYELMQHLRGRHGLTGLALTGYGMEADIQRSAAAGFVAHLTKPVTVQALERTLRECGQW